MISVVIPTLNASTTLDETVASITAECSDLVDEIVVSDGGSVDDTIGRAQRTGCVIVEGPRGRGLQLSRGAALARGAWLLFLHADTRLSRGWASEASTFMERVGSGNRAAVFTFALDDPSPMARTLERFVAWRVKMLALPYGDQGLLIHRKLYSELGGYRPFPLMEDVDLVRRLGQSRIEVLPVRAITSAARYRRDGYVTRSLRNVISISLYYAGVPPHILAKIYG
jgi:rSAM/selenodomain-associated transferase 2